MLHLNFSIIILAVVMNSPAIPCEAQDKLSWTLKIEMLPEKKPGNLFYYTEIRTTYEGELIEQKTVEVQVEGLTGQNGNNVPVSQYTLQNAVTTTETRKVSRIPVISSLYKSSERTVSKPSEAPVTVQSHKTLNVTNRVKQ